jgi:hypothetical protein
MRKTTKNNFFCIKDIKRNKIINNNNVNLQSLPEYLTQAKKFISYFSKVDKIKRRTACINMLYNEDAISHVAHYIMLADMSWDPSKENSLSTQRSLYAYYAILDMYRIAKRKQNCPKLQVSEDNSWVDDERKNINDAEHIKHLMDNSGLTENERSFIELFYLMGKNRLEISRSHTKMSREGVRITINRALKKMQKYDKKNK